MAVDAIGAAVSWEAVRLHAWLLGSESVQPACLFCGKSPWQLESRSLQQLACDLELMVKLRCTDVTDGYATLP